MKKSTKKIYPSIKKDTVSPSDFMKYNFQSSCDECTHFNSVDEVCSLGYITTPHRKSEQIRQYELSGNMALCRFMEID